MNLSEQNQLHIPTSLVYHHVIAVTPDLAKSLIFKAAPRSVRLTCSCQRYLVDYEWTNSYRSQIPNITPGFNTTITAIYQAINIHQPYTTVLLDDSYRIVFRQLYNTAQLMYQGKVHGPAIQIEPIANLQDMQTLFAKLRTYAFYQ